MSNLCLKINSKLGGTNSVIRPSSKLSIFEKPLIIFGADVTHPAPRDVKSPSIAAVTASMDRNVMEYVAKVKVLRHRQEVFDMDQLSAIVKEMLMKFYRKDNRKLKPQRIIFYRDGVSEGQFKKVIENEIAAIQKACTELEPGYQPGITFLVVQKRHHTRLFCADNNDKDGRGRNVPAGTIVDRTITHPTEHDFYLCSHSGIQGTSKPCHYHILCDDNRLTPDDIQSLTYQLCHCYVRCTRSVSYPAPTYYSHLVAFRARYALQDWEEKSSGAGSSDGSSIDYTSEDLRRTAAEMEDAIRVHEQLQNTMYFV
jgi:eukaryotic translation initiation factor 2C